MHYAKEFSTVEADVTYYRVPDRRMVQGWSERTPPGFVMSAKFPRSIVHAGEGPRPNPRRLLEREATAADLGAFLDAMALLGARCGPLVLQFPFFKDSEFAGPAAFLDRLDAFLEALPVDFRYAVEVRNADWVDEPLLALLRRHRAALVLVDLSTLPHPADVAERLRGRDLSAWTTDFAYARLIGDRRAVDARTSTLDHVVIDRGDRLQRWAGLLRDSIGVVPMTYTYANNHYAGFAPDTIRELAGLVAGDAPGSA